MTDEEPFLDFAANRVLRSVADFPQQGWVAPWKLTMSFFVDRRNLRKASIHDDMMELSGG